jgi:hypothetical protein
MNYRHAWQCFAIYSNRISIAFLAKESRSSGSSACFQISGAALPRQYSSGLAIFLFEGEDKLCLAKSDAVASKDLTTLVQNFAIEECAIRAAKVFYPVAALHL